MEQRKKVSAKTLSKALKTWYYGHLTCYSQEHMQTFGYLCSMLPVIRELYNTKEEQKEALGTYSAFFNTEPQVGSVIVGVTIGLEEARANGDEIDGDMINGVRAGLMGPLAGLGDSLVVGTLIPILLGIGLGLSGNGSPLGAIFYIVVWNLIVTLGMRFLFYKGYDLGGKAVEILVGEKANAIRDAVILLGTIVIGAVAASWINIKTAFTLTNEAGVEYVSLQQTLDSVFPNILSAGIVILCWWLMTKKKMSPLLIMLLLVVVAFVGVLTGFFDPGLSY